ncbi:hypothetical protein NL43_08065 [Methanosphaera sp. WGK6]|nr:hypothetical protein NL43_08065 [Methanosphaera sp. WGK6]
MSFSFKELLKEINIKSEIKNQYPVLSSTVDGLYLQENYFKRDIASKNNIGYKILSLNQIVLSPQNLWMGNINLNDKFEKGIVSPSYKIYSTTDIILSQFIKYILKTPRLKFEYELASEQGASVVRRNLNKELFNEIVIKVPSIDEQKKIIKILNTIDFKCQNIENSMFLFKKYKKGLLQQMFC